MTAADCAPRGASGGASLGGDERGGDPEASGSDVEGILLEESGEASEVEESC